MYRCPPSLKKNRERRRLWIADDNRVPVSPECWGQPLIGCNVNAMTQIISGVVIGEWTSEKIPRGKAQPLWTFIFVSNYQYLYFGSLEKVWEVKTTDVCCTGSGCVCLYRSVLQIKEKAYKIQRSQPRQVKLTPKRFCLMNWLFEKMNPLVVPVTGVKFKSAFLYA